MADEREKSGQHFRTASGVSSSTSSAALRSKSQVPNKYAWARLVKLDGDDLELQYHHTLESLGKEGGMLGTIFRKAQNKIQDPAKLERLIKMIDKEQWPTFRKMQNVKFTLALTGLLCDLM